MNIEKLHNYCVQKKGVTDEFPFDEDTLAFKVMGKIFCLTSLQKWEAGNASMNLKCDPDRAEELRARYEAIIPGYHMSKKHWNTVMLHQDVPDEVVLDLIDHSYDQVVSGLTKKQKAELAGL